MIRANFDDEQTRDGDVTCVSVQWKDTVLADVSVEVEMRGSSAEPATVNILGKQASISYKIWGPGYTTTSSN